MLPVKSAEAGAADYDLRLLSDREFAHLQHLLARARGEKPLPPREHQTRREQDAIKLAKLIDRIEASFGPMPNLRYANEVELADIKLKIHNLICCLAVRMEVHCLWEPEFRSYGWGLLPKSSAALPARAIPPAEAVEPAGEPEPNVLPMTPPRQRSIHDSNAPLKRGDEPIRTG